MNKKVSTIFAMAALMGGVFCSSAYAESLETYVDTNTEVESVSGNYFLKINNDYLASKWKDDAKKEVEYFSKKITDADAITDGLSDEEKKEALNQYLWTVSAVSGLPGNVTAYTFKNVTTGEFIRVSGNEGSYAVEDKTAAETGDTFYETYFQVGKDGTSKYDKNGSKFSLQKAGENDFISYDKTTQAFSFGAETTGETITLQKLLPGVIVDDETLNELYNSAGFNFNLKDDKLADVANIFGEKRIVAIKVPAQDVIAKVAGENIMGIKNPDPKEAGYGFPAGTYFVTVKPNGKLENQGSNKFDFLTRCTFVAVDADNNIADDEDLQKAGTGFTLTEVSGKDLVLYLGDDDDYKATGNQNSVYNACFSAKESTTENDVFDLSLNKVRFQEKAGAAKQVEAGPLTLTASKGASGVSTSTSTNLFAFEYAESSVIKPITLLKADGASIYNIRFYKANGKDNSVNGKYLTTTADKNSFFAKGKVLADLDAPAYQWVISKVDGKDVTFTNRESGATLTTQLFDEGNGRYSLAPKALNGNENVVKSFLYYNLTEEGNVEVGVKDNGNTDVQYFQGSYVELIESKAVNYAGYLNVDDETLMTLSFGRDIAPTSNKLYPFVTVNGSSYTFETNAELTNEVGEAAQWLLVKNPVDNTVHSWKYNYAYANGELVNIKNNGDVVYASTYALQLVLDGKVVKSGDNPYYLNISSGKAEISTTLTEFYIQENVDGSVLLKTAKDGATALFLEDEYTSGINAGKLIMDMNKLALNSFDMATISETTSKANEIKTYLIAEAPAISLPAVEGHYSFESETGNYITKDENRDAFAAREESEAMYLYVTDKEEVVPSFYVTLGKGEVEGERMFLFCPEDSTNYYVADGAYDKKYLWDEGEPKAIFKSAAINETRDTLTTSIKGEATLVAMDANNTEKVEGGLKRFKMQITEAPDADGMYVIRQVNDNWLYAVNGKLAWTDKKSAAMLFEIEGAAAPTATEGVSATEVKVIATDGAINIKNAAGKNVVISTILGQIVANEVITSDNATISVPAGIAIVSVDGEEAVKVSVK